MKTITLEEVLQLPAPARIRVVETIWDSIVDHPEALPLTEEQRPGLSLEFRSALDLTFSAIGGNPALYAPIYRELRRALLRRFPYAVFYVERTDELIVAAVLHTSRNPRLWRARLK